MAIPNLRRFIHRNLDDVEGELRNELAALGLSMVIQYPDIPHCYDVDTTRAVIYIDEDYIICMIRIDE